MRRTPLLVNVFLALAGCCACEARAQQPAAQTAPAPAPRPTGSIKGQVVDEDGRPVANVGLWVNARGSRGASAVTDEAGNFGFEGLAPGVYDFNIDTRGYTVTRDAATGRSSLSGHRVGDFVTVRLARGGVITGRVTDASGDPVVAAPVRAYRVREPDGQRVPVFNAREILTDDRGVYRVYGLTAGSYVVAAGGPSQWRFGFVNPFERDAPTYFPSATRDAAAEVLVAEGQESAGVDIRYRGEQGHAVSGAVVLPASAGQQGGAGPTLIDAKTGMMVAQSFVQARDGEQPFFFEGVTDGEYEVVARRFGRGEEEAMASVPLHVVVKGADVTGLKLTFAPLASISGTLALAPLGREERAASACSDTRPLTAEENIVMALREEALTPSARARMRIGTVSGAATADPSGSFSITGLDAGRYRLAARPASEEWYVSSISVTQGRAVAPAGEAVTLAAGRKTEGVKITLAEGAGAVRGRVAAREGAPPPPPRLRVHLVPAARERADDPFFFYEAGVSPEGTFALTNVAPGRYQLLARPSPQTDPEDAPPRPAAWDAQQRAALRRAAETQGSAVELTTCQRINEQTLRFSQ